jgi:hypothetical protein
VWDGHWFGGYDTVIGHYEKGMRADRTNYTANFALLMFIKCVARIYRDQMNLKIEMPMCILPFSKAEYLRLPTM